MRSLNPAQLKRLEHQLSEEKVSLQNRLHQNEHFGLAESQRDNTGELSMVDNHPGDTATEIYERGKDIALNEQAEAKLKEVEEALDRMNSGDFGKCATCGQPIAFERLEAVPTTRYCKEHSPEQSVSKGRSIEEEFLQPPFGRTEVDETDQNAFDGEDAWQIVESFGNSNSPAMAEEPDANDYNGLYIEADEPDGYVEPIENFLASDLYGQPYEQIIRSREYHHYMNEADMEVEDAFDAEFPAVHDNDHLALV